ncbi:diguanylate cyclase [Sporosarcina sp. FA9]|uniref:histidine kinase N-terminal 7TM domain-containing diguanylate cyclase n=1 Tax=Sporosarcina sp. FA9 TaxID=3413030 RepID=UPI003F655620
MPATQLFIYLLVYMIPTFGLFALGFIVLTQNPKRLKNQLVAILVFLFGMLFFIEFVRHLLPVSMSPFIINLFVGNTGLLIISVMLHFVIHITKLEERFKIPFYPYICYIPFILIILSMVLNQNYINNSEYVQKGIWYAPIFNQQYFIMMTISNVVILLVAGIFALDLKRTTALSKRKLLRLLITGTLVAFFINLILGYPNYGEYMPPHSHIWLGIVFSIFLAISVNRFQLLPSVAKRYQVMFDLSPSSISVVNGDWELLELNLNAKKELGIVNEKGMNLFEFATLISAENQLLMLKEELKKNLVVNDFRIVIDKEDVIDSLVYSVDASLVIIDEEEVYYLIWRNVTEELKNKHLVNFMAYHDGLTELHNRSFFVSAVKHRMSECEEHMDFKAALVLIDLDRFKEINDTYGHVIGDEVLRHTAYILEDSIRKNDTLARLGGDEFIIFLEDFSTKDDVANWIGRLRGYFKSLPYEIDEISIQIQPSIGVAFYPSDGETFEELYQYADMKMYEEKNRLKEISKQ